MQICAGVGIILTIMLSSMSCSGPALSMQEENVLAALASIQSGLESDISYEEFLELLGQAKREIDILKANGKTRPCFTGAVDKCYAFYFTGGKAWQQKLNTTDERRKNDMDLTLSVLQSRAVLSLEMANNCYKN